MKKEREMKYYAIREKETGYLMPAPVGRERRTDLHPQPKRPPRLWTKKQWAKSFLHNWCKGRLRVISWQSMDGGWDTALEYERGTERDRNRYEIVTVTLKIK